MATVSEATLVSNWDLLRETWVDADFEGPTAAEEREGAEIMACMCLDSFAPAQTFSEFLANQARLCNIREDHPWFAWLGEQIAELARRADFLQARDPGQYTERCEAMAYPAGAYHALAIVRSVAGLLESPSSALAPDLYRTADTLERIILRRN